MNGTLRPLNLGEILDRTAQLYRRNFWLFAGLVALTMGLIVVIFGAAGALVGVISVAGAVGGTPPQAKFVALLVLIVVVGIPLGVVAGVFMQGGLTQAAMRVHHGEKPTIREALKSVRPRFWRYVWLLILQGVFVALIPGVIVGIVVGPLIYLATRGGMSVAATAATGVIVFLAVVAYIGIVIWRGLGYSFAMAVCMAEDKPAWQSLQRTWKLSKGTRGRIFVMFLLVYALMLAATLICYIPLFIAIAIISAMANGGQHAAIVLIVSQILNVLLNFAMQVVVTPVSVIALVLFYYDQRVRSEGYDIEWMMQQAGLAQPPPTAPPAGGTAAFGPVTPPDNAPPDTVNE